MTTADRKAIEGAASAQWFDLTTLLRQDGDDFIAAAYQVLLDRQPDPDGLENFRRRLRDGVAKPRILEEIAGSPEGRAKGADLPGLDGHLRKLRLASLPLVGGALGDLLRVEGNAPAQRRMRALAYQARESVDEFAHLLADALRCLSQIASAARATSGADNMQRSRSLVPPGAHIAAGGLPPPDPLAALLPRRERVIFCYVDHTLGYRLNSGIQRVARQVGAALLHRQERVVFVKWDFEGARLVLFTQSDLDRLSAWGGPELVPEKRRDYPADRDTPVPIEGFALEQGSWLLVPEVPHITDHPSPVTAGLIAEARKKGLRTAFVFFDATPLRRTELAAMSLDHVAYMQALGLADLVLPISQNAADDLLAFMRLYDHAGRHALPRVVTLPLPGAAPLDAHGGKAAPTEAQPECLVLCVGTVTQHKNQAMLVRAFETFCAHHPGTPWRLVLAGNVHTDLEPEVARVRSGTPQIEFVRHVSDEQLDDLYRRCAFTVFPSVEEGFGLPILESLRHGKPCICANFGAMGEIAAGGGCLTVDTRDAVALARALQILIDSQGLRDRLAAECAARDFGTWRVYVDRIAAAMDRLTSPCAALGPVYYWIDHTRTYPGNSGIQRVVRGLARALIELGAVLIGVKWNVAERRLEAASAADLAALERWNGPPAGAWAAWREPAETGGWLLLPELTSYLPENEETKLRDYMTANRLQGASIFYDTIPWKMPEIYPPEATAAHARYMTALNEHELILTISELSRADLIAFLAAKVGRTPGIFERVLPCILPGEFTESRRIAQVKAGGGALVRILCVGTVEPRKNHLVLLDAFKRLLAQSATQVELVLAGSGAHFPALAAEVRQAIAGEARIRWIESPSDAALRGLYAECDFTVYPSVEEGFGLPILESLWHARPCVCAQFGAMAEVAHGGGCLLADVRDAGALAAALKAMVEDHALRLRLGTEASIRDFRTWRDYAAEVAGRMRAFHRAPRLPAVPLAAEATARLAGFVNLPLRPILSVCISTYQRADWLALSLRNLMRIWPQPQAEVEIVICDNASTDHTQEVVEPYLSRADVRYVRNPRNVGMLGNMRVTAHQTRGEYLWMLGDDDLVVPGAIEAVLTALRTHREASLVYLNYAYTLAVDPLAITDIDQFIATGIAVSEPGPDQAGSVRDIGGNSENFFTGIYCLVFRRDHGLRAYTQNIEGPPFSSLATCVPMAQYVLTEMIDQPALWIGKPQLLANMNVSWSRYASPYVLEQLPRVRDLAERMGVDRSAVDRWRKRSFPMAFRYFSLLFDKAYTGNFDFQSVPRVLSRLRGHDGIAPFVEPMKAVYRAAQAAGHPAARASVEEVFAGF